MPARAGCENPAQARQGRSSGTRFRRLIGTRCGSASSGRRGRSRRDQRRRPGTRWPSAGSQGEPVRGLTSARRVSTGPPAPRARLPSSTSPAARNVSTPDGHTAQWWRAAAPARDRCPCPRPAPPPGPPPPRPPAGRSASRSAPVTSVASSTQSPRATRPPALSLPVGVIRLCVRIAPAGYPLGARE